MDTSIKRQFRTKIHFAANDASSSRVLLDSKVAADIKKPGRAYARLPFNTAADLVQVQTAYIDKAEVWEMMNGHTILDLPVSEATTPSFAEQAVLDAAKNGTGLKECYRIYHQLIKGEPPTSAGGNQNKIIKNILAKWGVSGG